MRAWRLLKETLADPSLLMLAGAAACWWLVPLLIRAMNKALDWAGR